MDTDTGTHPIPSKNAEVAGRNLEDLDKILTDPLGVTNRAGNFVKSVSALAADYLFSAVNGGVWAAGQSFTSYNEYMVFSGTAYKPQNTTTLPYIVGASPDVAFVEVTGNLSTGQADDRYVNHADLLDDSAASLIGTALGSNVQAELDGLTSGQTGGVIVFVTKALLDAFTPSGSVEEATSYKVTNDNITTDNNGYYHWNGASFDKDAELVVNVISRDNVSDPVSGQAVAESTDGIATLLYDDSFLDPGLLGFIDFSTGVFFSSASYIATDFLEIMPSTDYVFNMSLPSGGTSGAAFYDKDQVFISGFRSTSGGFLGSPGIQNFQTSPPGAKYVRTGAFTPYDEEVTYIRSADGDYNIQRLSSIMSLHNPLIKSDNVDTESVDPALPILTVLLQDIQAKQLDLATAINTNSGIIDEITDRESPYFTQVQTLIKTAGDGGDETPLSITSRVSDTIFTVAIVDVPDLPSVGKACVVENSTGFDYKTYVIASINGGNGEVTISGESVLPTGLTAVSRMHVGVQGQHLTRFGYKAYAEHLANQSDKHSYRKSTSLFEYHPPICSTPAFNEPRAFDLTDTDVLADFEVIGGALSGGFVPGTVDMITSLQTNGSNNNISGESVQAPLQRRYVIRQNGAGKGVSLSIPVSRADGYIKFVVSCAAEEYEPSGGGSALSAGRMRVTVNDGTSDIVDQLVEPGRSIEINEDFSSSDDLIFSYSLEDNDITVGNIEFIYVYNKRATQTSVPMFKSGDNVAYLCDSWGVFPLLTGLETSALRPDGSELGGLAYLSEHFRDYLTFKGINVQTQNLSFGARTSEWGKFWVNSILSLAVKPTHCVIHFGINDRASATDYASQLPSIYDFDPNSQYQQLDSDLGGVFGSVNSSIWFSNVQSICNTLINAGIKPIVLFPPFTGSESQSQGIREFFTAQVYVGFRDTYTSGGLLPNTPMLP